ncbi:RNA methyltransferase [Stieleria sp. TO1_6]|uniref:TrmH family RNA methyltransferase n=1 Tax=Stieleria tagensis TaxID=2956795 RepID=UPI00209AE0E4|nr:TrmH family RNA methyltransferase [Stieleria tagensis]MCO8124292.1 RNA methyltransferase [Stieleria tagensis]
MSRIVLTSTSNPTVKHLVKLRDNRARRKAGRLLVDGWRETQRAIESGLRPIGVYLADGFAPQTEAQRWVCRAAADQLCPVAESVLQKIAYGQSSRGVVAEFAAPDSGLEQLTLPAGGLVLVLDHLEKPGNVGAAFRSADAAGASAVILTPQHCDRFNPNTIRSSLGTVFSVPSAVADQAQAKHWLSQQGYRVLAARVESSRPMWDSDLTGSVAIVIGSEADGLGDNWQSDDQVQVDGIHIPMSGRADSLNASVSAAVLLYEAARQRTA